MAKLHFLIKEHKSAWISVKEAQNWNGKAVLVVILFCLNMQRRLKKTFYRVTREWNRINCPVYNRQSFFPSFFFVISVLFKWTGNSRLKGLFWERSSNTFFLQGKEIWDTETHMKSEAGDGKSICPFFSICVWQSWKNSGWELHCGPSRGIFPSYNNQIGQGERKFYFFCNPLSL